jgi:hypothetical protein
LIGKQKLVLWAFTLDDTQQITASETPIRQHYLEVLAPRVCLMEESLSIILIEIQILLEWTYFSFQTYINSIFKFTILIDSFHIYLRIVCPRSSQFGSRSVKRP